MEMENLYIHESNRIARQRCSFCFQNMSSMEDIHCREAFILLILVRPPNEIKLKAESEAITTLALTLSLHERIPRPGPRSASQDQKIWIDSSIRRTVFTNLRALISMADQMRFIADTEGSCLPKGFVNSDVICLAHLCCDLRRLDHRRRRRK